MDKHKAKYRTSRADGSKRRFKYRLGHPTMAVDTHIFRVSNRTKIAPGKTVLEVEKRLIKFIPGEFMVNAHHWLILHGRYTCIARKPKCAECIINDLCEFKAKEL